MIPIYITLTGYTKVFPLLILPNVLAYFNKEYVNKEIFPKMIGRKISQAQRIREDSDYDDDYEPSFEKTEQQIETARELIKLVEQYIADYYKTK